MFAIICIGKVAWALNIIDDYFEGDVEYDAPVIVIATHIGHNKVNGIFFLANNSGIGYDCKNACAFSVIEIYVSCFCLMKHKFYCILFLVLLVLVHSILVGIRHEQQQCNNKLYRGFLYNR